ncbi:MAG: copper resistance CopC family protein [Pseudohongiellaceae bacterium]
MSLNLKKMGLVALLSLLPLFAHAHTGLKESTPAADATVNAAPETIELVFTASVRLVRLQVKKDGQELVTDFRPGSAAAASYSIKAEGMQAGKYTVDWAVIGADGHTVANAFSFVVDPTAAAGSAP